MNVDPLNETPYSVAFLTRLNIRIPIIRFGFSTCYLLNLLPTLSLRLLSLLVAISILTAADTELMDRSSPYNTRCMHPLITHHATWLNISSSLPNSRDNIKALLTGIGFWCILQHYYLQGALRNRTTRYLGLHIMLLP